MYANGLRGGCGAAAANGGGIVRAYGPLNGYIGWGCIASKEP